MTPSPLLLPPPAVIWQDTHLGRHRRSTSSPYFTTVTLGALGRSTSHLCHHSFHRSTHLCRHHRSTFSPFFTASTLGALGRSTICATTPSIARRYTAGDPPLSPSSFNDLAILHHLSPRRLPLTLHNLLTPIAILLPFSPPAVIQQVSLVIHPPAFLSTFLPPPVSLPAVIQQVSLVIHPPAFLSTPPFLATRRYTAGLSRHSSPQRLPSRLQGRSVRSILIIRFCSALQSHYDLVFMLPSTFLALTISFVPQFSSMRTWHLTPSRFSRHNALFDR
ncbi:hypothetical protein K439DRAFT_1624590 [Ramaria rubella]|nr:hypothetical protein K439DRAFT_1624590 [Ramaria rubella]